VAPVLLPAFEGNQGGNAADPEPPGGHRVRVGVELENQHLTSAGERKIVEDRRHRVTGSAPVGVIVHHHGHARRLDDPLEIGIGDLDRAIQRQRLPAFRAPGAVIETGEIHAVERLTNRTADQDWFHDANDESSALRPEVRPAPAVADPVRRLLLLAAALGCAGQPADESWARAGPVPTADEPDLRGTVIGRAGVLIRVEAASGEDTGAGIAVVRLTPLTWIADGRGQELTMDDIVVGRRVAVWFTGLADGRYPIEGEGLRIIVE
jgi:hypothetical protein